MVKYHINKQGIPAICRAKRQPCPLGEHFDNEKEANDYIQGKMEKEFGIIPTDEDIKLNQEQVKIKYERQLELVKEGKFNSNSEELAARTMLAELNSIIKGGDTQEVNLDDVLSDLHSPDSGATIAISSETTVITPTTGFCASPYPEHSKVFNNSKEVNLQGVLEFIDNIEKIDKDIFSQDETYIGLWNDPVTGKVYLDISKRYHTAEEASIACEQNDQIAYFDLQTFESVDVDRHAKSGQS